MTNFKNSNLTLIFWVEEDQRLRQLKHPYNKENPPSRLEHVENGD